jgi:Putative adhesin
VRTERFETPGPITLDLRSPVGEVEINTSETVETTVELEPLGGERSRDAVQNARVELVGDELLVDLEGERRRFFTFLRGADVGIRVHCPHGTRLRVNVVSADVHAHGRYGSSEIRTVSGDLLLGEFDGEVEARSVSGDLTVDRVAGPVRLESVSGDVRLDAAGSSVRAKTVSGDLDLNSVREGEVNVQTISGDARVAVEPGSQLHIDASSLSGDLDSDLEVSDVPGGGEGPRLEIRGKSVSGDFRVTRV